MGNKITLTILIVNFKTTKLTLACIQSIYDFQPQCSFEIVLVDNGSNDGIGEKVAEQFPAVRFIETGDNVGFSRANNLGIHNSRGEFVVLLNSDVKLIESVWDAMVEFMRQQPELGVIGCREVDGDGNFQLSCGHFPNFINEIIRKIMHYRLSINDHKIRDYLDEKYSNLGLVDWVSGSCMMIRRKALMDAGLLDEQFFMYFEDIDFCCRVQNKGWGIRYFPAVTICHYGGRSAKHNLLHVLVEYRRSQAYFTRKYYGRFGSVLIRIFLALKYGVNVLPWGLAFLIQKFLSESAVRPYTMLLLSKKVMGIALKPIPRQPIVTYLRS
ncbi:MAG TPA: glycosyltransferase family 2 protein [Candidatus Omnitrophota bacterium]|nr:glycosyltransferase family 2 protein [Candidatus Omnitrophota bacterium]